LDDIWLGLRWEKPEAPEIRHRGLGPLPGAQALPGKREGESALTSACPKRRGMAGNSINDVFFPHNKTV